MCLLLQSFPWLSNSFIKIDEHEWSSNKFKKQFSYKTWIKDAEQKKWVRPKYVGSIGASKNKKAGENGFKTRPMEERSLDSYFSWRLGYPRWLLLLGNLLCQTTSFYQDLIFEKVWNMRKKSCAVMISQEAKYAWLT